MKSGTNWICKLINLHPDIFCNGEYHWEQFFKTYQRSLDTYVYLERSESHEPVIRKNMEQMIRNSMIEMSPPSAKLIGDRTPNTIHPVVIRKAHHVCIIRDCRDIVVSKMFHYFNAPRIFGYFNRFQHMADLKNQFKQDPWLFHKNPEKLLSHEYFVRQTAAQWAEYLIADRNTVSNQPKLPVKLVKYEDVHVAPLKSLKGIFRFLEVEPAMVDEIPSELAPGFKKESPTNFYRKGQVGDWRNYMTENAKRWINEEAGVELMRQGYIKSLDWDISKVDATDAGATNAGETKVDATPALQKAD